MKGITVAATLESLSAVTAFLDSQLEAAGCPIKAKMQLDIAMDEIFSNIAYYAYPSGGGTAVIRVETLEEPRRARITFEDCGIPYDPLARKDPDITLGAEEREIGGLGIFMVKKTMDSMRYERRGEKNILTIEKAF